MIGASRGPSPDSAYDAVSKLSDNWCLKNPSDRVQSPGLLRLELNTGQLSRGLHLHQDLVEFLPASQPPPRHFPDGQEPHCAYNLDRDRELPAKWRGCGGGRHEGRGGLLNRNWLRPMTIPKVLNATDSDLSAEIHRHGDRLTGCQDGLLRGRGDREGQGMRGKPAQAECHHRQNHQAITK